MAKVCIDPVCKCKVNDESPHSSEHESEKVYFCSIECKEEFEKNPIDYMAENLRTGA